MTIAHLRLPMLAAGSPERVAEPDVARWVDRARSGDRAAFGRLIETHLPAARRLALAAVGQLSDADEAVQEAAVTAWQRLESLNEPAAFRAWFLRIVWRKALDRRRALKALFARFQAAPIDGVPAFEPAAPDPAPDTALISRELEMAIAQVVRALPRKLRDPFLLAASGDHRYDDIALLLGTPVGTVKWRISEARRLVRTKLARLGHGDPR